MTVNGVIKDEDPRRGAGSRRDTQNCGVTALAAANPQSVGLKQFLDRTHQLAIGREGAQRPTTHLP